MEEETQGKTKEFPEDVLNLELKFLDENVRPLLIEVVNGWRKYMGTMGALEIKTAYRRGIPTDIQGLLWQLRPLGRLTQHELEGFEKRNVNLQKMSVGGKGDNGTTFDHEVILLINDIMDKIAKCKLFARPVEETKGGLGALLKELADEEKAE